MKVCTSNVNTAATSLNKNMMYIALKVELTDNLTKSQAIFLKTFVFGDSKTRGIKSHTAQLEEAKQELSLFSPKEGAGLLIKNKLPCISSLKWHILVSAGLSQLRLCLIVTGMMFPQEHKCVQFSRTIHIQDCTICFRRIPKSFDIAINSSSQHCYLKCYPKALDKHIQMITSNIYSMVVQKT